MIHLDITHLYKKILKRVTLADKEYPNEMQQNTAFYQGLHCALR